MNFWHDHLQNPREIAPGKDYAPALAIYSDKDLTLTVSSTQIDMTIGGEQVTVDYVGETLESLAARITASSQAVIANPLNRSHLLEAGILTYEAELTPDGGAVVRIFGHIVRYEEETRIHSMLPYPSDRSRPWYPLIDRGNVVVERAGVRYIFGIPEYANQEWSTYFGPPFVDVFGVKPVVLSQRKLRVPFRPIFWYRNNISLIVNDIPTGATMIDDIDVNNGFIYLNSPVLPQDKILLEYTYREDRLIYKNVNLNPSIGHNPGVLDRTVLLYAIPEVTALGHTRDRAVYHVIGKTIVGAVSAVPVSDEPVLILGAYQVRPTTVIQELELKDTRRSGGGVRLERHDESLAKNREMHSYTDFGRFDGTPFPGAFGGVLTLPHSLLDRIEEDHIGSLVEKHLAVGGTILLDFDGE